MKIQVALMIAALLLAFGGRTASAKPEYLQVLQDAYKPYASSLETRSCANCHVSNSDFARNPYGKQLALALETAGQKKLTAAILQQVEGQSAGDGATFLDKIKAGTPPGEVNAASPTKNAAPVPTGNAPARAETPQKPWFPKYAYHPALVHFPIGLFIAGLGLDFLGLIRKNRTFLSAGWYNLVLAAISSLAGVATGYVALVLLRLPFTGIVRLHILLALAVTAILWILVVLRVHRHEKMNPRLRTLYYVLATVGLLLISYTGHLGGLLVYGE